MSIAKQKETTDYYSIIKEIAKLKRYELSEFKKRFINIIQEVNTQKSLSLPYRFSSLNTGCGFVFVPCPNDTKEKTELLELYVEIYKYKRRLDKCLGVMVSKTGNYSDIIWAFLGENWAYDRELENIVDHENKLNIYGTELKKVDRYKLHS